MALPHSTIWQGFNCPPAIVLGAHNSSYRTTPFIELAQDRPELSLSFCHVALSVIILAQHTYDVKESHSPCAIGPHS